MLHTQLIEKLRDRLVKFLLRSGRALPGRAPLLFMALLGFKKSNKLAENFLIQWGFFPAASRRVAASSCYYQEVQIPDNSVRSPPKRAKEFGLAHFPEIEILFLLSDEEIPDQTALT